MTLQIDNVSKRYGDATVLEPLSWSAEKGEILAVVGPSGSGKSTLLHLINLSTRPSTGAIYLDGEDLTALGRRQLRDARRKIGTAFQSAALFQRRTVNANVSLPLDYLGVEKNEARAQTARLVERVGLADRADFYPGQLSGGQKQRVGIARALALNPHVLLADEITSGLDPVTTASILDLIKALRDELQLTVVLVTHEMDVVRAVADKVLYLENGKVVEYDTAAALLRDPASHVGSQLLNWGQGAEAFSAHVDPAGLLDVLYVSDRVPRTWVSDLTVRFDTEVELIEALVEPIRDEQFGRARIRISDHAKIPDIKVHLATQGIAVIRDGDQ
ncbi:methionine ABC transporter ATP-binding protein [Gordonia soli]|uniref:Methionine ABC transporter ATP-binding protein n=1 Tax=Gordonia soli NBRC 108243 TaxID=1223545 RepID=M0QP62_9ACTN|nr:methionine ABC transporter ATP-binding protein [Gordonia soli]GAC69232.1 methionine ABC transporter ATP-binding protein [Gordonia soli NBRC 108243]